MVKQYPHILTATIVRDSYQDNDGNWVQGVSDTIQLTCRAEPNSSGRQVQLADGSLMVYSWTVYMPKTPPLPEGTQVTITSSPQASGKMLRFSEGQLNSRLWL